MPYEFIWMLVLLLLKKIIFLIGAALLGGDASMWELKEIKLKD